MWVVPFLSPATMPSGPRIMASSAASSVTMVNTASDRSATSRGEPASVMPAFTSHWAFAAVRL
jgi:hypothetical protein